MLAVTISSTQFSFFLFVVAILLSCSERNKPQLTKSSYWEKLQDSFSTKNLKSFEIDSQLQVRYKSFHQVKNRSVDSAILSGTAYLYSWQKNKAGFIEFTTFVNYGEHGSTVVYFIIDAKDSIRSATQVASKTAEGGIIYETRSRFLTADSLLKISSATTLWDLSKPDPWLYPFQKLKSDSTFFYLIKMKNGQMVEKLFFKKNELNLK